jgi:hypothetical protein
MSEDRPWRIGGTTFGSITIDGKTYAHDVIIRLSGEVVKRKKKLSKEYYGTSHVLSKDEAKFVFEKGCEQLILGSGQMGNVHLSPEAEAYFAKKGCKVLLQPTPEAIHAFNRSRAKKIGLFHITCQMKMDWCCPRLPSTKEAQTVEVHRASVMTKMPPISLSHLVRIILLAPLNRHSMD